MTYQVLFKEPAKRALERLDRVVRLRVFNALQRISEMPSVGKPLRGPLSGCRSFRVGDWRIVYEVHEKTVTVLVVGIGHRREIYETVGALIRRLS